MASEREIDAAYDATTECLELAKWLRDCIAETTQTLAVDGYPAESLADEAGEYLARLADALPRAESAVNPLHRELVKLSDAPVRIGTAAHWHEAALNWATMIYETVCDGVDPEGVRRGEIELTTDTWGKACAKLDGKIRDVDESVHTMLRVEAAKLGTATAQSNEAGDDAYVIAAKLWPTRFVRYEDCRAFLATSSIRTKGKGQRRLIHAADWINHWAAVDKAAFAALENCDGESVVPVTVDTEAAIDEAAERYRKTAARVRKK